MYTKKYLLGAGLLLPLALASSTFAADIQIWSNENRLENGNTLILDADDTGGDVYLQFGNTLQETLSWDSTNGYFNFSNNVNVAGDISLDGDVVMQVGATVDGVDVSELGTANAALEAQVNTNITNIAGNTSNIATNAGDIAGNAADITTNAGDIAGNATDIAALEAEQIVQNTNITTNATDIAALEAEQVTQNADIATNAADITSNDADIAALGTTATSLQTQITANDADIATNATDIAGNATDITALEAEQTTQDASIATNAANITSNDTDIATNATDIAGNATDIAALEAEQLVQNADITALETLSGDGDFTGATYITFGSTLTQALIDLDDQISTNTSDIAALNASTTALQTQITSNDADIATNASDIAGNATDIAALEAEQITQDASIATNATNIAGNTANIVTNANDIAANATDIAALETEQGTQNTNIATNATDIAALEAEQLVQNADITALETLTGDGDLTGGTFVSASGNLTDGILDLDAQLASEKAEGYTVPLGSVVLREDGTNNTVNIFRSADDGTDPHHYHKIISSKNSLQDMDLEHKVRMYDDFKSLNSVTLFHKAESTAADSKIDITITDAAGNVIASQTGLNSAAWAEVTLDISGATVAADDYIYITVKGYSKSKQAVYVGDLSLTYGEER